MSFFGAIAQLGERELCKLDVAGSTPAGSTFDPRAVWRENIRRARLIAWRAIIGLCVSVPVGRGTWSSTGGQGLNPHIPGLVFCDWHLWSPGPVRKTSSCAGEVGGYEG